MPFLFFSLVLLLANFVQGELEVEEVVKTIDSLRVETESFLEKKDSNVVIFNGGYLKLCYEFMLTYVILMI